MNKIVLLWNAHKRGIIAMGILLLLGLAYYIFVSFTGLYIPCVFRSVTGFACPGCGISHMCVDLLRLDFASAVRQNLCIAILAPLWIIFGIVYHTLRPKLLTKGRVLCNTFMWGTVVILMLFGILRNIPALSFLLPLYLQ